MMFLENEESKDPTVNAVSHAMAVGHNQHDANICIQDPIGALRYATLVLNRRWKAAEPVMFSVVGRKRIASVMLYQYCVDYKVKAPADLEQRLFNDWSIKDKIHYAIATNSEAAIKECDTLMLNNNMTFLANSWHSVLQYCKYIKNESWPEFEKKLLDTIKRGEIDCIFGLYYFRDVKSGPRWPEYEQLLKDLSSDMTLPRDYRDGIKKVFYDMYMVTAKERFEASSVPVTEAFTDDLYNPNTLILGKYVSTAQAIQACYERGERNIELEQYLLNNSDKDAGYHCASYAINILKRRWKAAEPLIIRDPERAIHYAKMCNLKTLSPTFARGLLEHFRRAVNLGKLRPLITYIIETRGEVWPEAEKLILECIDRLGAPHLNISGIPTYYEKMYMQHGKKWTALIDILLDPKEDKAVGWIFEYYKIVLKDYVRWPEFEQILDKQYNNYIKEGSYADAKDVEQIRNLYIARARERESLAHPISDSSDTMNESVDYTPNREEENQALSTPQSLIDYCIRKKRRWKQMEAFMASHPSKFLTYVKRLDLADDRHIEKLLLKTSTTFCAIYANDIKKARWPAFEEQELNRIREKHELTYSFLDYCQNMIDYRWEPLEEAILECDYEECLKYFEYKRSMKSWPEFEELLAKLPSYNYTKTKYQRIVKERETR